MKMFDFRDISLEEVQHFGPLFRKIYGSFIREYVDLYTIYLNQQHDAPIDPYLLFEIPPEAITHEVTPQFWFQPVSTVKGGDWDKRTKRFEDHFFYRSLENHFKRGVEWEHTELFERKIEELNAGEINTSRYGNNKSEILDRLRKLDCLYDSIKQDGYKTQRELRNEPDLAVETQREHLPPELFEIAVNIGRNGEWLFDDGRHRLTIAKILGLDTVPVRVLVRHIKWQELRNASVSGKAKNTYPSGCQNHEDLNIVNDCE